MSPLESAWPLIFVAAMVAVGLFIAWTRNRRAGFLAGIFACVLLGMAGVAIDEAVITPREQVSLSIREILQAFEHKQIDKLTSWISAQNPNLQRLAADASQRLTVTHVRLTDMSVEMLARNARSKTRFRVNANIQDSRSGFNGREATMWECRWQQEPGGWKLYSVQQLDPFTEKPLGFWGLPDFGRDR